MIDLIKEVAKEKGVECNVENFECRQSKPFLFVLIHLAQRILLHQYQKFY
jgi:hypothetical protein